MIQTLKNSLRTRENTKFAVIVNNKLLHYKNREGKNKIIYVYKDGKTNEINFGIYERESLIYADNKEKADKMITKFRIDKSLESIILSELYSDNVFGLSLPHIKQGLLRCSVNNEFRVVHLYTQLHETVKQLVNKPSRAVTLDTTQRETITLSVMDINKLKMNFLEEMYIRYKSVFFEIVDKKAFKVQTGDYSTMRLLKISGQFLAVTANGDFLYNPLFENKEVFDLFKESLFYKLITTENQPRTGKVRIYFLTIKEACEGLGIHNTSTQQKVFLNLTNKHVTPLLFGQYIDGIIERGVDENEDLLKYGVAIKLKEYSNTPEPKSLTVDELYYIQTEYSKDKDSTSINPEHYDVLAPTALLAYTQPIDNIKQKDLIDYFKSCHRVLA